MSRDKFVEAIRAGNNNWKAGYCETAEKCWGEAFDALTAKPEPEKRYVDADELLGWVNKQIDTIDSLAIESSILLEVSRHITSMLEEKDGRGC